MLRERVITAAVLLAILIAVVASENAWALAALCAAVMVAATWEWARLFKLSVPMKIIFYGVMAAGCAWIGVELVERGGVFALPNFVLIASAFWLFASPFIVARRPLLTDKTWLGVALGWVVLFGFAAALTMIFRRFSLSFLLAALAVPIVADTVAYFVGRKFGQRKLAPLVSPKKTVEGALGGLLGVAVLHGAWVFFSGYGWWWIGVFVVLAAYSILGDLFESLLKRQADMKDSSSLLPGHGGVLDRIDAQLPVLPLTALAVQWVPWQ